MSANGVMSLLHCCCEICPLRYWSRLKNGVVHWSLWNAPVSSYNYCERYWANQSEERRNFGHHVSEFLVQYFHFKLPWVLLSWSWKHWIWKVRCSWSIVEVLAGLYYSNLINWPLMRGKMIHTSLTMQGLQSTVRVLSTYIMCQVPVAPQQFYD